MNQLSGVGHAPRMCGSGDGCGRALFVNSLVLALGGELKNSFCLLRDGHAILSHHIGVAVVTEEALTKPVLVCRKLAGTQTTTPK